ncbi:1223_t:CDS:1 [Paraglomus brasilianum]|uniref:1223_t:CDS:1 n=1 Tax=Paraglomus brasilianum TaxID=144538 RepID=A0A9N8Z4L5_9GLOM|nr:1223_t:CDS:1 [Paraglomus brasilianum]
MSEKPIEPFSTRTEYQPIVQRLMYMVARNKGWEDKFTKAILCAHNSGVEDMVKIKSLADYYEFLNNLVLWVPTEDKPGTYIYNMLCTMYFVLDQKPVRELQSPVKPSSYPPPQLTPLSQWIVDYATSMGDFLSTPQSLTEKSLQTFYTAQKYNLDAYQVPEGGWLGHSFNELFARHFLPGTRPIDGPSNPAVIVSPADSVFDGAWDITQNSTVTFTVKGLPWSIDELLAHSQYANEFAGGKFMHAFLAPYNYHRLHAPVGGKVLEATVIPGQAYLKVVAKTHKGKLRLTPIRKLEQPDVVKELDAPDSPGYQFCQARGLIVIDSPEVGKVAVLPIGMAQVSSVQLSTHKGANVKKGAELAYFQFGGSDVVVVFQAQSKVDILANIGESYSVGQQIAIANI